MQPMFFCIQEGYYSNKLSLILKNPLSSRSTPYTFPIPIQHLRTHLRQRPRREERLAILPKTSLARKIPRMERRQSQFPCRGQTFPAGETRRSDFLLRRGERRGGSHDGTAARGRRRGQRGQIVVVGAPYSNAIELQTRRGHFFDRPGRVKDFIVPVVPASLGGPRPDEEAGVHFVALGAALLSGAQGVVVLGSRRGGVGGRRGRTGRGIRGRRFGRGGTRRGRLGGHGMRARVDAVVIHFLRGMRYPRHDISAAHRHGRRMHAPFLFLFLLHLLLLFRSMVCSHNRKGILIVDPILIVQPRIDPILVPGPYHENVPIHCQRIPVHMLLMQIRPLEELKHPPHLRLLVNGHPSLLRRIDEVRIVQHEIVERTPIEGNVRYILHRIDNFVRFLVVLEELHDEFAIGRDGDQIVVDGDGVAEADSPIGHPFGGWTRGGFDLADARPRGRRTAVAVVVVVLVIVRPTKHVRGATIVTFARRADHDQRLLLRAANLHVPSELILQVNKTVVQTVRRQFNHLLPPSSSSSSRILVLPFVHEDSPHALFHPRHLVRDADRGDVPLKRHGGRSSLRRFFSGRRTIVELESIR
mmetsp:Transcript_4319/g.8011  ORF Transcript_4319/g.8011 Transcript_4319/m.8011 type:complete len:585 (+) Transcript_4319:304-2058(+)